ncbi:hypothetical protein IEQ34_012197 [Dendrobium chrysotoxum]|uniref:Pentatricopeptide repeat-containing protein n=1 Tax=Dendrobium chrysotoxum TaxID=161865 RepID=A0AAV7GUJ0_DENCH|nr:hypothetical protein IEQ34_012197 [Dendrobium chrysotoxum]
MISSNLVSVRSISTAAELNAAISTHLRNHHLANAIAAFSSNPHHRNTTSWNLLISAYARHGHLDHANNLFDQMPHRDIISWNAILAAHRLTGEHLKAFHRFVYMLRLNFRPTSSTLSTIISASPPAAVPQLHVAVFRSGHESNTIVGTALVGGYTSTGDAVSVRRAFEDIPFKNSVSWTALIVGCMRLGRTADAFHAFEKMPERTTVATTALISGLIADGELAQARRCFDAAENRNAVTWTAIITGYLQYGYFSDALHLFAAAPKPNRFTFSAALAASARLCSLRSGESIHARILKSGEPLDTILATGLIDMYGRCGDADAASAAFAAAADYSVAVRNAMIGAMGMNGRGTAATEEFRQMVAAGVAPDGTTFVHVLVACVHGGLVEEGEKVFRAMLKEFKVRISKEHIGCMVDLYARAGRKTEAEAMTKLMPTGPDAAAVVAAAAAGGWVEVEEEMGAGGYALIARVYGERGEWEKVREIKERMEAAAGRKGKLRGVSWVESTGVN